MREILLSAFVIVSFIFYAIHERTDGPKTLPKLPTQSLPPNAQQITQTYQDGEYVGDKIDAYYGNVQVKTTIKNNQITDVTFLEYPKDRRTSQLINEQATPELQQEAIQVQSAKVDTVSGATQTSNAFKKSLQSSLAQAKI